MSRSPRLAVALPKDGAAVHIGQGKTRGRSVPLSSGRACAKPPRSISILGCACAPRSHGRKAVAPAPARLEGGGERAPDRGRLSEAARHAARKDIRVPIAEPSGGRTRLAEAGLERALEPVSFPHRDLLGSRGFRLRTCSRSSPRRRRESNQSGSGRRMSAARAAQIKPPFSRTAAPLYFPFESPARGWARGWELPSGASSVRKGDSCSTKTALTLNSIRPDILVSPEAGAPQPRSRDQDWALSTRRRRRRAPTRPCSR